MGKGAKRRARDLSSTVIPMVGTVALPIYKFCDASQRLIVIAGAVALWRGDVAVLVIIVLDRSALRLPRFVVLWFRRLVLLARSAHIVPFSPDRPPRSPQSNRL